MGLSKPFDWRNLSSRRPRADIEIGLLNGSNVRATDLGAERSEWLLPADSVEKQRIASAENGARKKPLAPFLSGFAHLLRCRKDFGQFAEVLGGCSE